jgi:hypothetical protein
MATEEHGWELSKENIQPLKRGRSMAALNNALTTVDRKAAALAAVKKAREDKTRCARRACVSVRIWGSGSG